MMGGRLHSEEIKNQINLVKMLPSEEIRDLVIEYGETKSNKTLEKIIEQNAKLVYSIASKYDSRSGVYDISDLIQEGILGVIKAVEKFDPEKGYMFSTYAYWWIEQKISRYVIRERSQFTASEQTLHNIIKIKKLKRNNKDATIKEIMTLLNISEATAKDYLYVCTPTLPLNYKTSDESDSDEIGDLVNDNSVDDMFNEIIKKDLLEYLLSILKKSLKEKEYNVIVMRYGLDGNEPMTLQQVGDYYMVSRERIRQIESKALRRLRIRPEFKCDEFESYRNRR